MAQSKSEVESNVMHTNRRKFMKGVTTGIVGATAIGASNNVSADIPWTSLSGAGLAFESSAIALDYLMGNGYVDEAQNRAANYIHMRYGDMRNYDGYTGASALHQELLVGFEEMNLADEQIMTGINNQIEMSDNVGYSKGKVALIESLNAGDDVATAKSKMNDALDDYYTKIQKAILDHYTTQVAQIQHMATQALEHNDLKGSATDSSQNAIFAVTRQESAGLTELVTPTDITQSPTMPTDQQGFGGFMFGAYEPSGDIASSDANLDAVALADYELINGELYSDIPIYCSSNSNGFVNYILPDWENWTNTKQTVLDYIADAPKEELNSRLIIADEGNVINNEATSIPSTAFTMGIDKYMSAMDTLIPARDRVNSNLQGFADDLYSQYQSGDLSLAEIVDPITYATEMATDVDNDAFRQVSAAQLGFSTNATENVTIQIHDEDSEPVIETDLYTSHNPTDGSWSVGTQYGPSSWSEPLFITYPDDDDTVSMAQLETPFTIQNAVDKDGNSVDTFQNRETNTQTADIASIQEELEKLRQTQLELQQDSGTTNTDTPQDSDGGSGGDGTNIVDELTTKYFGFPLYGWIAGGGVVTYVGTKVGNE